MESRGVREVCRLRWPSSQDGGPGIGMATESRGEKLNYHKEIASEYSIRFY